MTGKPIIFTAATARAIAIAVGIFAFLVGATLTAREAFAYDGLALIVAGLFLAGACIDKLFEGDR